MLRQHRFLAATAASLLYLLTGCVAPSGGANDSGKFASGSYEQLPSGRSAPDYTASVRINTELAGAYFSAGQYDVALEVISRALAAEPNSAVALGLQGLIYGELKDVQHARTSFTKALQIDGNNPDLLHNYGTFLCRNGKPEESLAYFSKAVGVPTYTRAANSYAAAGNCLLKLNRFQEAENQFALALRGDHGNAEALLGVAELHYQQRRYVEARADLVKLREVQQPSPASLWMGVRIERQIGNDREQAALSSDLTRLFPKSDEASRLAAGQFD